MAWHGYLAIKQLPPMWTESQVSEAYVALLAMGTQGSTNPAKHTHGGKFFDDLAMLIESEFDDAEITRAALVTGINSGVTGTSETEIDDWLDFELRAHPSSWSTSKDSAHDFVAGDTTETDFTLSEGFTIIVLPDTQYLSASEFATTIQWIVDNEDAYNIKAVLHVGDVVDDYSITSQWQGADAAFDLLDAAGIPYIVTIGNHDYESNGFSSNGVRDSANFNAYFPQSRYTSQGWWSGGFYDVSDSENLYLIITVDSVDYLLMGLEFGPRDAVIAAANSIATANSSDKIIIATHYYLYNDGNLVSSSTPFRSSLYELVGSDSNDGQEIWDGLVKSHSNIFAVVNGHDVNGDAVGRLVSTGDNDNIVNQMLCGHMLSVSDRGFVRLLNIQPSSNKISVRTYIPISGLWLIDPENKFELEYE